MKMQINSGIYLVVNPAREKAEIVGQLAKLKNESIAAIQIWDHPDVKYSDRHLIAEIIQMFKGKVPVLINNKWELLKDFELDGVHFDELPHDFKEIERELSRDFIKGITLGNDLTIVGKANELNFDYLSFCTMFPSKTVSDCEIVHLETVKKCRAMTGKPIFLSGGITPDNIKEFRELSFQGIAVVSGIMDAAHPKEVFEEYELALKR